MLFKKHKHKWTVRRTIWPYEDGYGTYCKGCKTVLDAGLPKEVAEARRDAMNEAIRKAKSLSAEEIEHSWILARQASDIKIRDEE